ncbi:MAG: hypothetical protein ACKO8N_15440, partial [Rubrivivax sp.]
IDAVADKTEVYAPVPEARAKKDDKGNEDQQDKHEPKPDDSAAVASWQQRMAVRSRMIGFCIIGVLCSSGAMS